MMGSLHFLVIDTEKKLGRSLKEEEINFLKWLARKHKLEQRRKELLHQ